MHSCLFSGFLLWVSQTPPPSGATIWIERKISRWAPFFEQALQALQHLPLIRFSWGPPRIPRGIPRPSHRGPSVVRGYEELTTTLHFPVQSSDQRGMPFKPRKAKLWFISRISTGKKKDPSYFSRAQIICSLEWETDSSILKFSPWDKFQAVFEV